MIIEGMKLIKPTIPPTQSSESTTTKSNGQRSKEYGDLLIAAGNLIYEQSLLDRGEPTVPSDPRVHEAGEEGPAGTTSEQELVSDVSEDRPGQEPSDGETQETQRAIEDLERSDDSSGNASGSNQTSAHRNMAEQSTKDKGSEVLRLLVFEARKLHDNEIRIRKCQLSKVSKNSDKKQKKNKRNNVKQQGGFYSDCVWDGPRSIFKLSEEAAKERYYWQPEEIVYSHPAGDGPNCIGVFPIRHSDPVPRVLLIKQDEGIKKKIIYSLLVLFSTNVVNEKVDSYYHWWHSTAPNKSLKKWPQNLLYRGNSEATFT